MPEGMDSRERARLARAMVEAFARSDAEGFLAHMTEDVLIRPSPFLTGQGEYRGKYAVRDGMAEMTAQFAGTGKRLRIIDHTYYVDADDPCKVLTHASLSIQRAAGDEFGTEIVYLWTFRGDLVCEVEAWLDTEEGLRQLSDPVELA